MREYPAMRALLGSAERVQWTRDLTALGVGEAATRGAAFALSAIVARELGIVALGALAVAQAIVWYALVVGDAGLSTDAVRRLAANEPGSEELIIRTTAAQVVVSLAATAVLIPLPFLFSLSRDVTTLVAILSVTPVLYALNLGYVLQARKRFVQFAYARAFGQICGAVCGIGSVYLYHSLSLAAASLVIGALISDILVLLLVRNEYKHVLDISHIHHVGSRLREGRGYLLYAIANHFSSSTPLLATAVISGALVVGNFSIAQRLLMVAVVPSLLISTASLPRFSRVAAVVGAKESRAQMRRLATFVLPIVAAASSALAAFSRDIVTLLFGNGAAAAAPATSLISILIPISYLSLMFTTELLAENRPTTQFRVTITGSLIMLTLVLSLTPFLGGRGTVIAMIVGETMVCVAMNHLLVNGFRYLASITFSATVAGLLPFFISLSLRRLTGVTLVSVIGWFFAAVTVAALRVRVGRSGVAAST